MNNLVAAKFDQLSKEEIASLKQQFSDAPKMLRYIELLTKKDKNRNGIKEAVQFIYKGEAEGFEVLRNRFFKLRKKLLEHLEQPSATIVTGVELLPLEAMLFSARRLVISNNYHAAKDQLEKLIAACKEKNVFELLPDALHHLIFCNLALNSFGENNMLYDDLEESNELLFALNQQRLLARKIYQLLIERRDETEIRSLFKDFKKIADRYKAYPRFTLYYHFIFASQGSVIFSQEAKQLERSFALVKKLSKENPDMPVAFYEPHGKEMLRFYLAYGEAMKAFQEGDTLVAYHNLMEAWAIMESVPALRSKKTESNYINKIAIEVATKKYTEALRTSEEMLQFLMEQKDDSKKLKAYSEMVQIYSYAFPDIIPPDAGHLTKKLDEFLKTIPVENKFLYYGTLLLKAIFLFQHERIKEALACITSEGMKEFLESLKIGYHIDLIQHVSENNIPALTRMQSEFEMTLKSESRPEVVYPLQRAVKTIRYFIKKPGHQTGFRM